MKQNTFHSIVGTIFSVIACLHFLRILGGWSAVLGQWVVPMWLSWLAVILAAFLAYHAFKLKNTDS